MIHMAVGENDPLNIATIKAREVKCLFDKLNGSGDLGACIDQDKEAFPTAYGLAVIRSGGSGMGMAIAWIFSSFGKGLRGIVFSYSG
jgi:hypothetical protein